MRTGPSLYLRNDGRWEARYQKGRDKKGHIIYGFVYGATQEEAEKKRSEVLRELFSNSEFENSNLPTLNPNISSIPFIKGEEQIKVKEKIEEAFNEEQAKIIDKYLSESDEESAIGFYLSLHMGISLGEILALKYKNINRATGKITIENVIQFKRSGAITIPIEKRKVVVPGFVKLFLKERHIRNKDIDSYVLTGTKEHASSNQAVGAKLRNILNNQFDIGAFDVNALRSTFIRRCLESNMNVESVSLITGLERSLIYRYYGKYIQADPNAILRLDDPMNEDRSLNLLILGAGSHGHTVKETAEKLGIFSKIKFLDDIVVNDDVIGRCDECAEFVSEFPCAFVAIGNNQIRKKYAEKLKKAGYMLPHLIHPDATVSKDAKIGDGTIIMAQATVNAATVGELCIVASNALINFGANISDFSHIDCGGIIKKNANLPSLTFVQSGEIFGK